jgi:hypothetical protein
MVLTILSVVGVLWRGGEKRKTKKDLVKRGKKKNKMRGGGVV